MTTRISFPTVLALVTVAIFGLVLPLASAGTISYVPITNDTDSGISTDNIYTHTLDFGTGSPGALINGVQFDAYNNAANGSLNFNREAASGSLSDHGGNGNHNVSGGLVDLMTDMYYNGNNAVDGVTTWTLSGLAPGRTYHMRIYTRIWGAGDNRLVTFVFDPDGAGPVSDATPKVSQDNATSMGFANGNDAYYINYQFKAVSGEDLVITATQDNLNNSWHLYGLTNQEFSAETAVNPSPAYEAIDVLRDTDLSWESGDFAATHDVYVGDSFAEVDGATVPIGPGLDVVSFDPGRLELGKTYYWRVDEVNSAPDNTVFKGEVWSFTVEPVAIPVENITATASGANPTMGPEKTIDGSGLNELGQHSTAPMDMWLTLTADSWIQYEFDKAYKLYQMQVWNSNQAVETFIGFGVNDALVETSLDGETWTTVEGVGPFAQGSAQATYEANTSVDFGGAVAKYVRITPQNAHGITGQSGLSEVYFSRTPTEAREFLPADGSISPSVDVTLGWRAGREAASHEVYLGTDPSALALAATTDAPSFLTEDLDYDQTYYWQVVEVNEAQTPATYTSEILSFTTPASGIVDDFETYSGEEGQEVFMTWFDGFGGDASLGGSTTGHIDSPFVEITAVYAGQQSLPIYYDNDGGFINIDGKASSPSFSEVVREFDSPQDWTANGIKSLSLYVLGAPDNRGQLYLKINNTRVDGAPDISQLGWQTWNIDLSSVGATLQNVATLAIGIDGENAAGTLYIDSIRLYPQVRAATAPAFRYVQITSDEDCGISADNTYTHALDFGIGTPGALVNGIQFDAYNNAANGTLNFNREVSSGDLSDHAGNNEHNVSGSVVDLLTDMYYNGGTVPGGTTTWTLSGLTAGQTYHTRIYTRMWGATDSRVSTFVFDPDGAGPISDSTGQVSQDNAMSIGFANGNDAYYINYQFTAVEGEDLVITLTQHINTYSWHLYGLTNQEVDVE